MPVRGSASGAMVLLQDSASNNQFKVDKVVDPIFKWEFWSNGRQMYIHNRIKTIARDNRNVHEK
jgi:hypothetical protein